jgi:L-threonylcarbamoyladenylate synthase
MANDIETTGRQVGILALNGDALNFENIEAQIVLCGRNDQAFAANLFAGLRTLDAAGVDVILARAPEPNGIGLAIWDRLVRAAEGKVVEL